MDNLLVTTADERTWGDKEPIIFLGEWCKRLSRAEQWGRRDSKTVAYPWDNRDEMFVDYKYLVELNKFIMSQLTPVMNNFHGRQRSTRYWQVVIGPWLGYFVAIVFERWKTINYALTHHAPSHTILLDFRVEDLIPQNMNDFHHYFSSDIWNHWVYSRIIEHVGGVKLEKRLAMKPSFTRGTTSNIRRLVINGVCGLSNKFWSTCTENDYFIYRFVEQGEWLLNARLGQGPFRWKEPRFKDFTIDLKRRSQIRIPRKNLSEFENILFDLLPLQLPAAYVEGFETLTDGKNFKCWPKSPKKILTSSAHYSSDFFKVWAAEKMDDGSQLIIRQHGGHFGSGKWNFLEDHDMSIGDIYLSWGWQNPRYDLIKAVPSGFRSLHSKAPMPKGNGKILIVLACLPRYSYWMYSIPVASQYLSYANDQKRFLSSLDDVTRSSTRVRLYPSDYGWDQKLRFARSETKVALDVPSKKGKFKDFIKGCKLVVATFNSTLILESLAANFPTIAFWNPAMMELRPSAERDFNKLREFGILHNSPESAAKLLLSIQEDIEGWWFESKRQSAIREFCGTYSRTTKGWVSEYLKYVK